ncbi:FG-GAP repeat domain-containing protein [Candidatus Bipolaricaulota bacterium]
MDIVAEDFNQDGWLDLAVSCSQTGNVFYYQNNGSGVLPQVFAGVEASGTFPNARFLVAGHMPIYNGYPDLAVVHSLAVGAAPHTLISTVAGAAIPFGPPPFTVTPAGGTILGIAGGNLTNGNVLDLAWITAGTLTVAGGPGFALAPFTAADLALADFDQNGWDDIVVVTASPTPNLLVYFNNPGAGFDGTFLGPIPVAIPNPTAIEVGDFDGDSFPDIVVVGNQANPSTGTNDGLAQPFMNNLHQTAAAFVPLPTMLTWGFDAKAAVTFDADGNGRDDFAVANWGSRTVSIFLSDAVSPLVADTRSTRGYCLPDESLEKDRFMVEFRLFKLELQCGFYPISLASGDFDRNGKMDLAVALQSSSEDLCAQNPSCIEIDFDVACGFVQVADPAVVGQTGHVPGEGELQTCPDPKNCEIGPCDDNTPPGAAIQTGSDESKNP